MSDDSLYLASDMCSSRFGNLAQPMLVAGSLLFAQLSLRAVNITLAWDPSPSPDVTGYHLYVGGASETYTNIIDIPNGTSVTVTNLTPGATYYFAVTAYDASGLESTFSGEIAYTVPPVQDAPVKLQATLVPGEGFGFSTTAPAGNSYDVLAGPTCTGTNWTVIGSAKAAADGSLQFTDPTSAAKAARFYRLRQTGP